jgi:hypothetical protein
MVGDAGACLVGEGLAFEVRFRGQAGR